MAQVVIKLRSGKSVTVDIEDEEVVAVVYDGRNISNEQDQVVLRNMRDTINVLLLEAEGGAIVGTKDVSEILEMPIALFGFSERAFQCLRRGRIVTVGDLVKRSEDDLLRLANFGQRSLDEVESRLLAFGLRLSTTDFSKKTN